MTLIKLFKKINYHILFVLLFCLLSLFSSGKNVQASTSSKYASMLSTSSYSAFNIRARAGLTGSGFNIMEGGCTDGTYGYYAFLKPNTNTCKIVKVSLGMIWGNPNSAVVKVSAALSLGHANDMCYNPESGQLIVIHNVHNSTKTTKISIVNASTLKIVHTFNLQIPAALEGATEKQLSSIKGLCGIAYSSSTNQYVVMVSGLTGNFLLLDSSLTPVKLIKCEKRSSYVNQGIDCTEDSIYVARSNGSNPNCNNILEEYSWDGNYKGKIDIKGMTYEIENVYHIGDTISVACYARNSLLNPTLYGFAYKLTDTPVVTGINVQNRSILLRVGSTASVNATVLPQNTSVRSIIYMSNKNKVARVSGSGLVTAKAPGKAKIIMCSTQGYYTKTATVTVVGKPKISKLENWTAGIRIKWPSQASSTRITIWRRAGKKSSAKFKRLAVVRGNTGSYVDKKAKPGKFYSYRLVASNGTITTPQSSRKSIWRLKTPKITSIKSPSKSEILVRWKKVKGASYYKVVYSSSSEFRSKKTVKVRGHSSTKKGLTSGKTYYVKIYAYHKGGKKIRSHVSKVRKVKVK